MRDVYRYVMVWVELLSFLVVILLGQYHAPDIPGDARPEELGLSIHQYPFKIELGRQQQ